MTRSRFAKATAPELPGKTQLEKDYGQVLEARKRTGEIRDYRFEAVTLILGSDCRYTCDWFVMANDDVIEMHECKGPKQWDDAIVKLRVAARAFPFRFFIVRRDPETRAWDIRAISP